MAMTCGWKILWSSRRRIRRKRLLQTKRILLRERRRNPGARFPAVRPISVPAGFSAAFVPGRSLPPFCFPARALVRVRVLSPVLFRSWAEPHFLFQSWAGLLSGVSQIDAGGKCPHSPGPAEQTSQGAAVAPVVCAAVPVVAASGRALVARCSDFPGSAEQLSQWVAVVAPGFCAVDPSVAAPERARVVRTAPAAVFRRKRAAQGAPL